MRVRLKGEFGEVEIEADQKVPTGFISPYPATKDIIDGAIKSYKAMREISKEKDTP